jgi:hypothetical protein
MGHKTEWGSIIRGDATGAVFGASGYNPDDIPLIRFNGCYRNCYMLVTLFRAS